ncbi:methyltransferase family protein [Tamaricihabitans halophyticus]|uniref:Methyltransferase family protein n=1 Tax=Tamaricihabitans halophyticus TaxID=1262583 RepID=A0A4R2R5D1_9PSEU|nr:glycosyltransferase [Tamaricihabitans halophyticus]TCP57184.1 methyltransferase family protein [Tamaricihabitans halophyticus]
MDYADGAEADVLRILAEPGDSRAGAARLHEASWDGPALAYHFAPQRAALLAPLNITAGLRVLDVGCGSGPLTRALGDLGAQVVGVEGVPARAKAAELRCRGLDNVRIEQGALPEALRTIAPPVAAKPGKSAKPVAPTPYSKKQGDPLRTNGTFDLALLCGVLEYSATYGVGPRELLAEVAASLTEHGVLALAVENQLGLGYLLGRPEDHHGGPWLGPVDYPGRSTRTWTRHTLSTMLTDAGLGAQRWLLPYPDYKLPRAILDAALLDWPDGPEIADKLVRDPLLGAFGDTHATVPTRQAHRLALAEGFGAAIAPAFLVLAARDEDALRAASSAALGWLVTDARRARWRRRRELRIDAGEANLHTVRGEESTDGWLSQRHIAREPVLPGESLDAALLAALREPDLDAARELLSSWRTHCTADARELRGSDLRHPYLPGDAHVPVLPADCLDVHPGNLIRQPDGGLVRIDREWHAGTGVDAELVLLRGLWDFAREMHAAGEPHPWHAELTPRQLVHELAGLAGLSDQRWLELVDAEAALQKLVLGKPRARAAAQLRDNAAQAGRPRQWDLLGGVDELVHAARAAETELRTERDRQRETIAQLTEALTNEREHAEQLNAELGRRNAEATKLLAERDTENERLRGRIAELDTRLGLALGELTDFQQERAAEDAELERASKQLDDADNRLRNSKSALQTAHRQLALARRIPGLRRLINRRAGDELFYGISLPDKPIHCGRGQLIELSGWVVHATARVRAVTILVAGKRSAANLGGLRPDVAANLAEDGLHAQQDCGVYAMVPLPARSSPGKLDLGLEVELYGGRRIRRELGSVEVLPEAALRPLSVRWPGSGQRVAVCMATYNPDRTYLAEQLDSLRGQTHDNWVCILCDDGSNPAGRRNLAELTAGDDRFILVESNENVGFYRNFERALERVPADADAIALSDQDDVWDSGKLARLLEEFEDPAVQLVYSDMRLINEHGTVLSESAWPPERNQYHDLVSMLLLNTVTGASSMVRPGLVRERVLPFPPDNEATYHDQWIAATALAAGKIAFVAQPQYSYRQHGSNVTGWQLPQLDRGLPSIRTLLALAIGVGGQRWLHGLSKAKRGELDHIAGYELRRIVQFASLLHARNSDKLAPELASELRKLRVADRKLAPLVELALRAKRAGRGYTAGAEKRLLASVIRNRAR